MQEGAVGKPLSPNPKQYVSIRRLIGLQFRLRDQESFGAHFTIRASGPDQQTTLQRPYIFLVQTSLSDMLYFVCSEGRGN